jgi:glycerophosphoryl diester phosphodiesterase
MAGWRVDLEEKSDGTVIVHHDDAPDSSARVDRCLSSWEEAVEYAERVRDELRDPGDQEQEQDAGRPAAKTAKKTARSSG